MELLNEKLSQCVQGNASRYLRRDRVCTRTYVGRYVQKGTKTISIEQAKIISFIAVTLLLERGCKESHLTNRNLPLQYAMSTMSVILCFLFCSIFACAVVRAADDYYSCKFFFFEFCLRSIHVSPFRCTFLPVC